MGIDLHVHSSASDGTDSPAQVMAAAAAAGLRAVALTDHDTTAGWPEASAAALALGIGLVPGAELSCASGGISLHLLSYLHDPLDEALLAQTARVRKDRLTRARLMVERISADHDISWADVVAMTGITDGTPATVGRPHIADALVAKGLFADRDETFMTVLNANSPYYVPHYAPDAAMLIRLVVAAGGIAVLAHPRAGRRGFMISDAVIAELSAAGLAGLEVDHRDHDAGDRAHLRGLAADLGLLGTGSSDYHGTGKRNELGENTTSRAVFEQILARGSGTAAVGL